MGIPPITRFPQENKALLRDYEPPSFITQVVVILYIYMYAYSTYIYIIIYIDR